LLGLTVSVTAAWVGAVGLVVDGFAGELIP